MVEYDIVYTTRKVVKRSVIANHLADNAIEDYEPLIFDFPDEDVMIIKGGGELDWWTMYFNIIVNVYANRAGAMIISLDKKQYPVSIKL